MIKNIFYNIMDCCYGTVLNNTKDGIFIMLDNGEQAFSYKFTSLRPGTKVMCTVLRPANDEAVMRVAIDSVCSYATYLQHLCKK